MGALAVTHHQPALRNVAIRALRDHRRAAARLVRKVDGVAEVGQQRQLERAQYGVDAL